MHIPDSAISPATSLISGAAMVPVWFLAGRRVQANLETKQVPLLAIGAAFCFTIMMFNIPVPGGTTVHPVGGGLLAILLGPWAAIIGVTVALVIQALFFGDGGVLAAGANCFTMAFAMPFCAYFVYRLLSGRSAADSPRRALAAGLGAYVGLNVAALLTAVLLGIQPTLYHEPNGHALYFPFGLHVTIPAILAAHLTIAGTAEGVVTALVVRYLQASHIPLYGQEDEKVQTQNRKREMLWVGLAVLAALSPLGLLASGDAWGEWGTETIQEKVGYVPSRLSTIEEKGWKGFNLLPDYLSDRGKAAYILAAVVGIALISLTLFVLGWLLTRKANEETTGGGSGSHRSDGSQTASTVQAGEIPAWLTGPADPSTPDDRSSQKQRTDFVEMTLLGLAHAAQESIFAERWARQEGLLQKVDPRVKIIGLFSFVVLAAFLHRPAVLLGLYGFGLLLGVFSRLPLGMMIKRVWLSVPLFVGAVTLPAALNLVTPGQPLLVLLHTPYLAVTAPGLALAATLTLRVGLAVSFVVLLTLTTRWNDLLRGLRALFVPKLFLTILAMTYRYIAVLMQTTTDMFTARKSRTVGKTSLRESRSFLGGAMGALFGKSLALTDEVHAAMLSRGWTGEAIALHSVRPGASDLLWLGAMALVALLAVGGEVIG